MQLIPLGFLVLGLGIVITLFMSIFKLINFDFEKEPLSAIVIFKIFKFPLLFFMLFIFFITYGIPALETS